MLTQLIWRHVNVAAMTCNTFEYKYVATSQNIPSPTVPSNKSKQQQPSSLLA